MSAYANLPLSALEKHLDTVMEKYSDLDLQEGDNSTALSKLSFQMKELGEAIEVKKSRASIAFPAAFHSLPARPPKRESDCRAFKKYGSCKRGNRCWWKHDPRYRDKSKVRVATRDQENLSEEKVSTH